MSNDLRDSWSNIHSYDGGTSVVLDYDLIVEELEHLLEFFFTTTTHYLCVD